MQKVRLIHSVFLSLRNGANTVMRSLLENRELFAQNGIVIDSLTPDNYSTRVIEYKPKGWKSKIKTIITDILTRMSSWSIVAASLMFYIREMRSAKKMASRYLAGSVDPNEVVFFHALYPCYYYLKNRKVRQHAVVVLHTNGDTFKMSRIYYRALKWSPLYKKALRDEQYVLQHADKINFVSKFSRANFLRLHPDVDPSKVFYIYNGVPTSECPSRKAINSTIKVVCVASITERKGQRFIIDALKLFEPSSLPNVHFTMVGDGEIRNELEKEVREHNLSNSVNFAGVTTNVDQYLRMSDIYILPSEDEGLPMAIIEAMRSGLPIVSTPVGGIPEMIDDGVNGLLIDPSAQGVYNFLLHIRDYDWRIMGMEARIKFESHFTVEKMIDAYSDILKF